MTAQTVTLAMIIHCPPSPAASAVPITAAQPAASPTPALDAASRMAKYDATAAIDTPKTRIGAAPARRIAAVRHTHSVSSCDRIRRARGAPTTSRAVEKTG